MELKTVRQDKNYQVKITAEEEGKVLGWAFLVVVFNDRHVEPYGIMENVYVEQEHRGKGIGTQLVQAVIAQARAINCYKLIAQSRDSKPEVHAYYEKMGFNYHGKNFRITLLEDSNPLQKD